MDFWNRDKVLESKLLKKQKFSKVGEKEMPRLDHSTSRFTPLSKLDDKYHNHHYVHHHIRHTRVLDSIQNTEKLRLADLISFAQNLSIPST